MLAGITVQLSGMEGEREAYLRAIVQQAQVLARLLIAFQMSPSLPKDSRLRDWVDHAAHVAADVEAVADAVLVGRSGSQLETQTAKYQAQLEAWEATKLEDYKARAAIRDDLKSPS